MQTVGSTSPPCWGSHASNWVMPDAVAPRGHLYMFSLPLSVPPSWPDVRPPVTLPPGTDAGLCSCWGAAEFTCYRNGQLPGIRRREPAAGPSNHRAPDTARRPIVDRPSRFDLADVRRGRCESCREPPKTTACRHSVSRSSPGRMTNTSHACAARDGEQMSPPGSTAAGSMAVGTNRRYLHRAAGGSSAAGAIPERRSRSGPGRCCGSSSSALGRSCRYGVGLWRPEEPLPPFPVRSGAGVPRGVSCPVVLGFCGIWRVVMGVRFVGLCAKNSAERLLLGWLVRVGEVGEGCAWWCAGASCVGVWCVGRVGVGLSECQGHVRVGWVQCAGECDGCVRVW